MTHRLIRWITIVTLLGLVVPALPVSALAQDAADASYQDPEGRFTIPVPAGWNAEDADGYGVLSSPEQGIVVSVMALDEADPDAAAAQAWSMVDPDFDMEPLQRDEVPTQPGTDTTVIITYDAGQTSGVILQALVIVADGVSYVMLFDAELMAAVERQSQINIIAGGLQVTGTEQVSLEGVQPLAFEGALVEDFDAYIEEVMELLEVPGASIAIVQNGDVVYRNAFGVTEVDGNTPMQPETRMMIGSTTKSLTTMMLATMVDEGLFEWDTPVVEILPWFAVADDELTPQITVQDLVCACTGVPRRDLEMLFNFDELTAEGIVSSLAGFEFFTPIGEAFQYSNQMVAAGGFVGAAAVHGEDADLQQAYLTEMQERVLGPMGLSQTTFDFDAVIAAGDYATPHGLNLDNELVPLPVEMEEFVVPVAPSGGLWSNVDDMAQFMLTELADGTAPDGTELVSAENLHHTWEPQVPIDAASSYGLGWIIEDYHGQRIVNHGGNTLGFTSDLAFLPESNIGIVVLTNGQATNVFSLAARYRLLELVFEQEPEFHDMLEMVLEGEADVDTADTGVPLPEASPVAATPVAFDVAEMEPYAGEYVNEALGSIWISTDGETVVLDAGEFQTDLRRVPDTHVDSGGMLFLMEDPPVSGMPVVLEGEGTDVRVVLGEGTVEYTFVPASQAAATPSASPVATPAAD